MKHKLSLIGLLLVMCLVAGMLPTGASAAENGSGRAMNYGTGGVSAGEILYYGTNDKNDQHGWIVLDAQKTNTGRSGGLFLLFQDGFGPEKFIDSNKLNYTSQGGTNATRKSDGASANTWQGSDAQDWCKKYASTSNFTAGELAAIPSVSKSDPTVGGNVPSGLSELKNEKVFLLSAKEFNDYKNVIPNDNWGWWTRSPYSALSARALRAWGTSWSHEDVNTTLWMRPAFNINQDSVLFTSAASGGKSSNTTGANLTSVSDYTGNDWKLTLIDKNRSFTASIGAYDVTSRTVTAAYSGASAGSNEYVSAVIMDGNNITHYGRLKNTTRDGDKSGTVRVTLPSDFDSKTNTLYLFSEQYNGDKKTDYASDLQKISFTFSVTNELTNITSSNKAASVPVDRTENYAADLKTTGDYVLPESITVTVGGTALTAGENTYTYDSSTGELIIKADAITGNIVITAKTTTIASIEAPAVAAKVGEKIYTPGSWASDDVTLTVSGSSAPSGIGKYQYSTNGGESWSNLEIGVGGGCNAYSIG